MNKEFNYGSGNSNSWNDKHATGNNTSTKIHSQEEVIKENPKEHLDIHNSNRNLDKYLFYFSSKL